MTILHHRRVDSRQQRVPLRGLWMALHRSLPNSQCAATCPLRRVDMLVRTCMRARPCLLLLRGLGASAMHKLLLTKQMECRYS